MSERYNDRALDYAEKLMARGSRTMAMDVFSKIIYRSKKQSDFRDRIVDICLDKGEFDYALSLLEQAIKENPLNHDLTFKTGMVYLQTGDHENALVHFKDVDRNVRGHVDAKLEIAKIFLRLEKVLKADEFVNQVLRIEPGNEAALSLRRHMP